MKCRATDHILTSAAGPPTPRGRLLNFRQRANRDAGHPPREVFVHGTGEAAWLDVPQRALWMVG